MSAKCKEAINSYLESKGHDGIVLDEDKGSFGRSTKAYIALYPEQVKSTNNPQPTRNHDVRFSFAGESALNADNKMLRKAKEMYDDFESSEDIRKETGWHRGAVTRIDIRGDCTACRTDLYWSHRKHGGARGSQIAMISLEDSL